MIMEGYSLNGSFLRDSNTFYQVINQNITELDVILDPTFTFLLTNSGITNGWHNTFFFCKAFKFIAQSLFSNKQLVL